MSYKILLIDHDLTAAERIRRPLADADYDVTLAGEAANVMPTFERVAPDLVMIEALLPGRPGSELCQEIKDSDAGRSTPVVLLLEPDEERQAMARALDLHGCDLLIERSIPDEELLGLCEQLLRARPEPVDAGENAAAAASPESDDEGETAVDEPGHDDADASPIDSGGLADALTRLDDIIDRPASDATGLEEVRPETTEKVLRAQKAGDFSFLAQEADAADEPLETAASAADGPDAADPPVAEAEDVAASPTAFPGESDSGQDISDHLDSLFAPAAPGEPTRAEKKVLSWTFDSKPAPRDPAARVEEPVASVVEEPRVGKRPAMEAFPAPTAGATELPGTPEITWEEGKADAPAPAEPKSEAPAETRAEIPPPVMQTTEFAPASVVTPAEAPSRGKWWLLAACAAVLLIGGGLALMLRGGEPVSPVAATPTPVPAADTAAAVESPAVASNMAPTPESPLADTGAATPAPADAAGGDSDSSNGIATAGAGASPVPLPSGSKPQPVAPPEIPPVKVPRTKPVETRETEPVVTSEPKPAVAAEPRPAEVRQPQPVETPPAAPAPVRVAEARPTPSRSETAAAPPANEGDPTPTEVASAVERWLRASTPEPVEAEVPEPVTVARANEPAPPVAKPAAPPATASVKTEADDRASAPAAAAPSPEPPPTAVEVREPELIARTEPSYPSKGLKRARGERLVLRLMVNEEGRVVRVVVEEGISQKDVEAAAVGAVLRWSYQPGTRNGKPAETWTEVVFDY